MLQISLIFCFVSLRHDNECVFVVSPWSEGETEKQFTEIGTIPPIYLSINDLYIKAVLFRVSRKFSASQNFPGRGEIVADRPRGTVPTSEEYLRIYLWRVSERLLLGDVGMKWLNDDGPSPKVVGHD